MSFDKPIPRQARDDMLCRLASPVTLSLPKGGLAGHAAACPYETMDNNKTNNTSEDEISLIDYLIVLAKRKKLIISLTLFVSIATAIISLILPPVYKAETTVLPPRENAPDIRAKLLGSLDAVPGLDSSMFGGKSVFMDMIKSRTVLDRIIDRFGLMEAYEAQYRQDARKRLEEEVAVESDRDSSLIRISVNDRDPEKAANMANAFVEELKRLAQNLAITKASQRRLFFEEKLKQAKEDLLESEEAMMEFQEKTGMLKVEDQAKAVIESITALRAKIAAKEVELKVMKTYTTVNNPDLQKVQEELDGLKLELAKLEQSDGDNPDPLMPTGRMPAVGTKYLRKLRDLRFNETIYEIMAKQYEMARMDEAKDAALIQVIDRAVPPEKRFRPARIMMVMIATVIAFFISVFLAFIQEYIEGVSEGGNRERVEVLKKYLSFRK